MYRRMIFIGLGGSGGKTIRFLKREIRRWLKQMDWQGDMPRGWQFLHIDSPTAQDGTSVDVDMLPDDEYLGLVGPGVGFSDIVMSLDSINGGEIEMEGWRVDPAALGVPVGQGAGQFRAVGRTIALAYLDEIQKKLRGVIGRVNDSASAGELQTLANHIHGDNGTGTVADPMVVVVSSLAGGTGAGLFMDVCDLLREMASPWGGDSFALLYTPEVFDALGAGATGGVQPNSLAAISELMNGAWLHGGIQGESAIAPRTSVFHTHAGSPSPVDRSGPAFPLLIGRTGGAAGVAFGTDVEVFEMVGRALMSWATDPVIQDDFLAYEIANWANKVATNQVSSSHDVVVNAGRGANPKEAGEPLFSSIGFSRVSLGNTYFEDYSERRLGLDAARWAVEAVRLSANATQHLNADPSLTDSEVAGKIAADYLEWFLRETKLHERGPDENDVIEALFPKDEWHSAVAKAESRVLELSGIIEPTSSQEWQNALIPAVRNVQLFFFDEVRPAVDDKVRVWIGETQERIIRAVEEAIASHGLQVARALVDATIAEISGDEESVVAELRGEAADAESYAQNWEGQIRAALGQASGKLASDHPAVQSAIADSVKYATQNLYAYLIRSGASLLEDLGRSFLMPLRNALSGAAAGLEAEMDGLSDWPAWGATAIPKSLRPPRSEITVLKPEEFPGEFEKKLSATVGGSAAATGNHRRLARNEILTGSEVRAQLSQADGETINLVTLKAIDVSNEWWPGGVLPQEGRVPTHAAFHVRFTPTDLLDRASHWLNRTGTAFHDIFSASLATYTAPDSLNADVGDPMVYQERQQRFLECFATARAQSTPLIRLNAGLLHQLHDQTGIEVRVSTVPFAGHPIEEAVANELQALFGNAQEAKTLISKALSTDKTVRFIDIMSTLQAPVSPLVVDSLMAPIASAWESTKSGHVGRSAFWTHRRARRLCEFVPMPREHLYAMVRGYFTSRMLGLLDLSGTQKIAIRTPDGGTAFFPDPPLRPWTDDKDLLPVLLESFPLAMIEVGRVGTVDALVPYNALRDYGWQSSSQRESQMLEYNKPAEVLRRWLDTGEVDGLRQPLAPLRGLDSAEVRREAVAEFLLATETGYESAYREYLRDVGSTRRKISQPPEWPGIWPVISQSLQQLAEAVRESGTSGIDDASM